MNNNQGFFSNIKGDFLGGITAGIVALPLALAFGEQTELGAVAGLYGAIALGVVAALFGGTKTQISGPTAPMTVVAAVLIMEAIKELGGLQQAMPVIIASFILTGIIQAALGLLKLGKFIKYIPYPVISGFMSGIGVIIIVTQIFPFFGAESPAGGALGTISNIHRIPELVNVYSVVIALVTVVIIYVLPFITKKIPATLIALLLVSIVAYYFIPDGTLLKINSKGDLPTGLPDISFDFLKALVNPKVLVRIIEYSFTLAALGSIDSLLTSVVADNVTKTKHDSNRELIGQGLGNMVTGFIGGLPGAGATMRTVINIKSGGRGRLSGVVAGLLLAGILLGLGQLVGHIPNAVLAGILITVGVGIIDYKGLRHIRSIPRAEAVIMVIVLLLTVFVDLLVAVGAGMVLAAFVFMKETADIVEGESHLKPLKDFKQEGVWDDEKGLVKKMGDKVFIKHIEGPLFFGMVAGFKNHIESIPGDVAVVIFRMERVSYVDQSGLYAMEEAVTDMLNREVKVLFWGLKGQPKVMFEKIDIVPDLVSEKLCFDSSEEIESFLEKKM